MNEPETSESLDTDGPLPLSVTGRSERRAQLRSQIRAASRRTMRQNVADDRMLKRKRQSLRRQFGSPHARRKALIAWVHEVNGKRGVIG